MSTKRSGSGRTATRRNVLVMSEDAAFRRIVRQELREQAYHVRTIVDPGEILPALAADPSIDAICYDTDNVPDWTARVSEIRGQDDQIGLVLAGTSRSFTEALTLRTDGYLLKRPERQGRVDVGELVHHLDTGIRRMDASRARIFGDATILEGLCAGLSLAISGIKRIEALEPSGELEELYQRAYDFADKIYRAVPIDARQKLMLVGETTEGGIARVTSDLASLTDMGRAVQMLKRLREQRVRQVVIDHTHFRTDKKMPLEEVYIGLTLLDIGGTSSSAPIREGYLLKEYIPGPNLTDLFMGMRRIAERRSELLDAMKRFRDTCVDIALDRVHYWQEHALAVDDERNPARVAQFYEKQLPRSFETFLQYATDVPFSHRREPRFLRRTLAYTFNFRELISLETIRRNLAATYRNIIFRTPTEPSVGDLSSDAALETLVEHILVTHTDSDAIAERIVHVDTHRKYSHLLEDCLEITDAYEAGLSPEERHTRLGRVIAQHEDLRPQLEEALPVLGFYRAMRKIFFFIDRFGRQNYEMREQGRVNEAGYQEKQNAYDQNIRHHLGLAKEWLAVILEKQGAALDHSPLPTGLLGFYSRMKTPDFWITIEQRYASEGVTVYADLLRQAGEKQPTPPGSSTHEGVEPIRAYIRLNYLNNLLNRMIRFQSIDYSRDEAR